MRCMSCGVEMRLVGVVPDETVQVAGYARHSFECPACRDTETRLLFGPERVVIAPQVEPDPVPVAASPPPPPPPVAVAPPVPVTLDQQNEVAARTEKPVSGAWARAITMLRRRYERPRDGS